MNERITYWPHVPVPPIYGQVQYPGGIVHAVEGDPFVATICGVSLAAGPHWLSHAPISCQDCLCRLASGQGEV